MANSNVWSALHPGVSVNLAALVGDPNPETGLLKISNVVQAGSNFAYANPELAVAATSEDAGDYQPGSVQLYQIANAGFASGALLRGEVGTGIWEIYGIAEGDINKILTVTSDTPGSEAFAWQPPASQLMVWNTVSGTSGTLSPNNAYVTTNSSLTTLTLPVTAVLGDTFKVYALGTGGWTIVGGTIGQTIRVVDQVSGADTTNISSTQQGQCVELVCVDASVSGSEIFAVVSGVGNSITW